MKHRFRIRNKNVARGAYVSGTKTEEMGQKMYESIPKTIGTSVPLLSYTTRTPFFFVAWTTKPAEVLTVQVLVYNIFTT